MDATARTVAMALLGLGLVGVPGCATGPVRYKTLGRYEYATVRWTQKAPVAVKPLAAAGGAATDVVIAGADTVFTPLASVPMAASAAFWGPDPGSRDFRHHPVEQTVLTVAFYPFWFVAFYATTLYGQTYETAGTPYFESFYPGCWGDESRLFKANPITRQAARQGVGPRVGAR